MFSPMRGRQILIAAPDDAESRELAELLRSGGHLVAIEADPAAAALAVGREGLGLVVLDLQAAAADPAALAAALTPPDAAAVPAPLEAVERAHILVALRHTHGNKRRAAHLLGIARSTLIQKVRRYQIHPDEAAAGGTAAD
jgi:DNA-binding NtrC family response regulator